MTEEDVRQSVAEMNRRFFGGRLRPQLKFHRHEVEPDMHASRRAVYIHKKLLVRDPEIVCTLLLRSMALAACTNEKATDEYRFRRVMERIGVTPDDGRVQQFGPFQTWFKEWLPILALPNWARP
jgi:hypothetical protein